MTSRIKQNKTLVLIVCLVLLLILTLVIQLVVPSKPLQNQPSPTPQKKVAYDINYLNQDAQRIQNRQELNQEDQQTKNRLINLIGNKSGIIHETDSYSIQYIQAADWFMVEITSTNTDQAKNDTVTWLKDQGFSIAGICNLPVKFYLSEQVSNYFTQNNKSFNPIPPGC